jgi:hypothetical protein
MVGDLLCHFQLAAVLQIRRDAGRAKGMIANPRFDAGRFRAPADDAVGVLLEEGIGCKLTGLALGSAEEIAVDVIGDAGRFDIIVQTLIETMMAGNVVLLAAFGAEPKNGSSTVLKIVFDLQIHDRADPAASTSWCSKQGLVQTINDDSGVDWIHKVQARLHASAGVFTVVALKSD